MVSQDLLAAVDDHLSKGESPDEVKEFLLSEGWAEGEIDSVLYVFRAQQFITI